MILTRFPSIPFPSREVVEGVSEQAGRLDPVAHASGPPRGKVNGRMEASLEQVRANFELERRHAHGQAAGTEVELEICQIHRPSLVS